MYVWIVLCLCVASPVYGRGKKIGDYDDDYGTYIGKFSTLFHDVSGDIYAVDNVTLFVKGFNYDGEAPDAFFFAGNQSPEPSNRGFIIADEKGNTYPLGVYRNKNLVLKFPITKAKGQRSLNDIKWISIWCRQFAIDFGSVNIPTNIQFPSQVDGGSLVSAQPLVEATNVIIEDTETIRLEGFSYDGSVADAIFVMGSGEKDADGYQIPNEKGSLSPIGKYNRKSLRLKLPDEADGNIQYFGIWSPTRGMLTSVTFEPGMRLPPAIDSL